MMFNNLERTLRQHTGRVVTFKLEKHCYVVQRSERSLFFGIVKKQEVILGGRPPNYKTRLMSFVYAGTEKSGRLYRRVFVWDMDWETFRILSLEKGIIWKIEHGI